jgi:hypothetical protein
LTVASGLARQVKHLLAWAPDEPMGAAVAPTLAQGRRKCASHDYTRYRAVWNARYPHATPVALNTEELSTAAEQERSATTGLRAMLNLPAEYGEESKQVAANSSRLATGELERLINGDHRLLDAAIDNLERRFWFVGVQVSRSLLRRREALTGGAEGRC